MMNIATTSDSTPNMLLSTENTVSKDIGVPKSRWDAPIMAPYARYCSVYVNQNQINGLLEHGG